MTDSTNTRRRRDSRAAKRAAARRADEHAAGRFVTGAHVSATAAAREQVPADVREAARGREQVAKRDTSRRHVRPTDGSGDRVTGWNVECTRRTWRGEGDTDGTLRNGRAVGVRREVPATRSRLYLTDRNLTD